MANRPLDPRSFAPELLALFLSAVKKEVVVRLDTENQAKRLRARLYRLRRAHREANTHYSTILENVEFSIRQDGNNWLLIAGPSDRLFVKAIREAGVDIDEIPMEDREQVHDPIEEDLPDTGNFFDIIGGDEK